jgi:hypothetical protein
MFFKRIIIGVMTGFLLGLVFTILFSHLLQRSLLDQIMLVIFSTAAFGYLTFSVLESGELPSMPKLRFDLNAVIVFLREKLPAILLSLSFLAVYIYLGSRLNNPRINTTDNYLDADNSTWVTRIAESAGSQMEMRGPHPFAYFVFRPLGWLLNLFTRNPNLSAILLNAFAGCLCVFLTWMFMENQFKDRIYASLIAALLGLSTSHLWFGSLVETYIFSAAALIGFYLLLQTRKESTGSLVAMSLLTFGITFTNFVQNFIGFMVSRPRLRDIIRFAGLTISIGVIISLAHAAWYPSAKLFFVPSDAQTEGEFATSIFQQPTWKALGRVVLLVRTIVLYSIIAPRPFVFTTEVGGTFPRFNFFKVSPDGFLLSSYHGLGNILVVIWAGLLFFAFAAFLWNLVRTRKAGLSLAFALCLVFNFALHLNYGYEPFLYSPDWTYALILFVALGLAPFAKNRWFQVCLLAFLILLAYNQWEFFKFVFGTISPFVTRGS